MNTLGIHAIPLEFSGYSLFLDENAFAHVLDRSGISRPLGYANGICSISHRLTIALAGLARGACAASVFVRSALFRFELVQAAYQLFGETGIGCRCQFEQVLLRILR